MASIKGIELKNVKDFRGHEGEDLVQGDVYYKGKKVGYYSQDAWGGMDIFDLDYDLDTELRKEIKNITDNYVGNVLFKKLDDLYNETYKINFVMPKVKGYEYLFSDLLELLDQENLYKKYSKKWGVKTIYIVYNSLFDRHICGAILQPQYKDKTYFKYNSLKNFVVE